MARKMRLKIYYTGHKIYYTGHKIYKESKSIKFILEDKQYD